MMLRCTFSHYLAWHMDKVGKKNERTLTVIASHKSNKCYITAENSTFFIHIRNKQQ